MAERKCVGNGNGNSNGSNGSQLARKRVNAKLQVVVEGRTKQDVEASYANLVDLLQKQLPIKMRMGRGLTTTINVEARA